MPPSSTTPAATIQYLTRLLSALVLEHKGELRISQKLLRRLDEPAARQVLLEDIDLQKDEIVLRFGSKHSAIYPVEPQGGSDASAPPICQPTTQPQPQTTSSQPPQPVSPPTHLPPRAKNVQVPIDQPQVRPPLTDAQIARAERTLHQIKTARAIVRKQPHATSSSPSDGTS